MALADNDTVTTIGEGGKRVWLYPKWLRGRMLTRRTVVHWVLLVLLLIGPWIDIGGHPATRIDIPGRRMYFWGATLMATDGAYMLFAAGIIVFSVFFFTALFGRAWCGWSCPQTVFIESLIRPFERLIEGDASARRKLDAGPWTRSKVIKKAIKYAFYLVVAGTIGTTFTAYFLGRGGVIEAQLDPLSHPGGTAVFVGITAALLFDFAYFREQTCLVVCPYGRFQSVLLDADSLAVGYDERRGEPRGKANNPAAGDCVDCKACVRVCPTGIDIRKGNQMECVQCMACIDACDDIMVKLQREPGLIRLDSQRRFAKEDERGFAKRALRPRVIAYGLGLIAVLSILVVAIGVRQPVGLDLHRMSGTPPYAAMGDRRIQNSLELRIQNRRGEARSFTVELVDEDGTELLVPGGELVVEGETTRQFPVFVLRPAALGGGDVLLRVRDDQGFSDEIAIEFLAGSREAGGGQQ
ncbi:putative electron transport protein YccM [Enhygromyxa salina]|uniref:Putative electron transport protein YccM n=1 Tax=Enhygromyxa salina TaxID=215803 RepID=A0A2S9XUQ3_9BACT|nr:cytochrome c oxidase accessory protein CcoG [Enhygromyxa salina]PRP96598.1 putative electron transport protein YccM [Enhygromyxa salina]